MLDVSYLQTPVYRCSLVRERSIFTAPQINSSATFEGIVMKTYSTGVPGLTIIRQQKDYRVVHDSSNLPICTGFRLLRYARRMAARVGNLAIWTRHSDCLRSPELAHEVRRAYLDITKEAT